MSAQAVSYEARDGVAVITIERPDRRNALNPAVVTGLNQAWQRLETGAERAAVLASRGDDFSVGADLKEVPADLWRAVPGVGADVTKPIVAATSGWCVGGAFVLVQMSDLCVAAESTKFLYPEAKIGLTGGVIASLAARVPHKIAMEFMLLGEPMSARRAYEVGMINRVVPDGEHVEQALAMARALAGMAPLVVRTLKSFVTGLLPEGPVEQACRTRRPLERINASRDFAEGVAAFKAKRPPRFTGE